MSGKLKRKSFFIDERELAAARQALGARTDAETVRAALREVAQMATLVGWKTEAGQPSRRR
jgi:hypothetical protein